MLLCYCCYFSPQQCLGPLQPQTYNVSECHKVHSGVIHNNVKFDLISFQTEASITWGAGIMCVIIKIAKKASAYACK